MLHLQEQVIIRVETKEVVKTLLVVPVAAFYFSVVPGHPWPNLFVLNLEIHAEDVHGMYTVGFDDVIELAAIVRLDRVRFVSEVEDCPFDKVTGLFFDIRDK